MITLKSVVSIIFCCILLSVTSVAVAQTFEVCPKNDDVPWTNCHGSKSYPDGSTYVGDFQAGQRHGRGMLYSSGGISYLGEFANDQFDGSGVLWMPGGIKFAGEFRQGRIDGLGIMNATAADKHIGEFKDGILTKPAVFLPKENTRTAPLPPASIVSPPSVDEHMTRLKIDILALAFLFCFTGFILDLTYSPPIRAAEERSPIRKLEWFALILAIFFGGVYLRPTIDQLAASVGQSLIKVPEKKALSPQIPNRTGGRMMPRM
jgi:hypothetical protein